MRRLAILVVLLLAVAAPAAASDVQPRLTVTAASVRCADGLPVVDYSVTNQLTEPAEVTVWWVADASVWAEVARYSLGPAPDQVTGSFTLPFDWYSTVTVFATAVWPDGTVTVSASWAIPVADCTAGPTTTLPPAPSTTSAPPTTDTTLPEATTTTREHGRGRGGGGNG